MPTLKFYRDEFRIFRAGSLPVGAGTTVKITDLTLQPDPHSVPQPDGLWFVTAAVNLSLLLKLAPTRCDGCDVLAPPPDQDALWFLINHQTNGKLVFAGEEALHEAGKTAPADLYPVRGWRVIDAELFCVECVAKIDRFKRTLGHANP